MPVVKFGEIESFWFNNPNATDAEVHDFTGDMTKRLCDCKMPLRRFERWNGECEECRRARGHNHRKRQCGCMIDTGGFWLESHGWHVGPESGEVFERCPKFWDGLSRDVTLTKTIEGRKVSKSARVVYHVSDEDRRKITKAYFDEDGREIPMGRKRPDYD